MDTLRFLDILGFLVGLIYLWLEYRASIWLWLASIVMPAIDSVLYYKAGLYADFGMAIYYCVAAIYGFVMWWFPIHTSSGRDEGKGREVPITHFPLRLLMPAVLAFAVLWAAIWYVLVHFTDSSVPVADAFTTALSVIALWALARKFAEQWLLWLVVDVVCCWLYVSKGIPFKAAIYGLYSVVAILGYRKWVRMISPAFPPR